jgi:hypothetical protein
MREITQKPINNHITQNKTGVNMMHEEKIALSTDFCLYYFMFNIFV